MNALLLVFLFVLFIPFSSASQTCLWQGIDFNTQAAVDSFAVNYPGCNEIEGNVIISGSDITNLDGLNAITSIATVSGSLFIRNTTQLADLTGLENLAYIGGDLNFFDNSNLVSLSGLEGLTYIDGDLNIGNFYNGGNPALLDVDGLISLTGISGDLNIWVNPLLNSLDGLESLVSVGGRFLLQGTAISDLNGLMNLQSIGEEFTIQYNYQLADISGLSNLDSIGGYLTIVYSDSLTNLYGLEGLNWLSGLHVSNSQSLQSLTGLENLETVEGDCRIQLNESLSTLAGLSNLATVGNALLIWHLDSLISLNGLNNITSVNRLAISDNPAITTLEGLEHLAHVTGLLAIANNNSLVSLAGIENIGEGSVNELVITNNDSLNSCNILSVCLYLANPGAVADIDDNAPGCNSRAEVEEDCIGITVKENDNASYIKVFPNPARNNLFISGIRENSACEVSFYNQLGQNVLYFNRINSLIDISGMKSGLYFIEIKLEQDIFREKILVY